MQYTVKELTNNIYQITLHPQTRNEIELLGREDNRDRIENYYHLAVAQKLGANASLLEIINSITWPFSSIARVEFSKGLG
jgi:hypothetical protein